MCICLKDKLSLKPPIKSPFPHQLHWQEAAGEDCQAKIMKSRCRCQAPWVDAVIPSHQSCHSAPVKKRVSWLSALLSALTVLLWAVWHWVTLPRRWRGGGRVAAGEERYLSEHRYSLRLSLLSHPPKSAETFLGYLWDWILSKCVYVVPVSVCVPPPQKPLTVSSAPDCLHFYLPLTLPPTEGEKKS